MTVQCRNCGAPVSDDYARVLAPEAVRADDAVRCCPHCEDKLRRNGRIDEARASRHGGPDRTRYDPEKANPTATDGGTQLSRGSRVGGSR